eukprot:TRINITY_DN36459_c0_g2_i1.p1 TRINITY_DN36459_c0_g2~~TRINITY_DN36459_c0_g2_i1.p1  ORF type:complete len:1109 (-),score=201.71 TRINITY_DN36459_c0_g2_i1:99-3425(-)
MLVAGPSQKRVPRVVPPPSSEPLAPGPIVVPPPPPRNDTPSAAAAPKVIAAPKGAAAPKGPVSSGPLPADRASAVAAESTKKPEDARLPKPIENGKTATTAAPAAVGPIQKKDQLSQPAALNDGLNRTPVASTSEPDTADHSRGDSDHKQGSQVAAGDNSGRDGPPSTDDVADAKHSHQGAAGPASPEKEGGVVVLSLSSAIEGDKATWNGSLRANAVEFVPSSNVVQASAAPQWLDGAAADYIQQAHISAAAAAAAASTATTYAGPPSYTSQDAAYSCDPKPWLWQNSLHNDVLEVAFLDSEDEEGDDDDESDNSRDNAAQQLVQMIIDYLRSSKSQGNADKQGYLSIQHCIGAIYKENGRRGGFNTEVSSPLLRAIRNHYMLDLKEMKSDKQYKRVRLLNSDELVRVEASREIMNLPRATMLPISKLLAAPALRPVLRNMDTTAQNQFVREALSHEDSNAVLCEGGVQFKRKPPGAHLKKALETLLSEHSVAEDSQLRQKLQQTPGQELSMMWLCSRYTHKLNCGTTKDPALLSEAAEDVCQATKDSTKLIVDTQRLTVRPRKLVRFDSSSTTPSYSHKPREHREHQPPPQETSTQSAPVGHAVGNLWMHADGTLRRRSTRNAGQRLQQLLDFYFESFNLQHNRLLLNLVAQRSGPPLENGPWSAEALKAFAVALDDLSGLNRIAAELTRMRHLPLRDSGQLMHCLGPLRHMTVSSDGRLLLSNPPEVRRFLPSAAEGKATAPAMRYLTTSCEQRGKPPPGVVSITSLHAGEALLDESEKGERRRACLKRQLLLHLTDLICLQGFDSDGRGNLVATALAGEGYSSVCSRVSDFKDKGAPPAAQDTGDITEQAWTIFWDRSRWKLLSSNFSEVGAAVTLSPFDDLGKLFRVVCMRPLSPTSADAVNLLVGDQLDGSVIVCADMTAVGGAEAKDVVEELADLNSLMLKVAGKELEVPWIHPEIERAKAGDPPVPILDAASTAPVLHKPDAMFYGGLAPATALSCHSVGYLVQLNPEDTLSQFPSLRLPIVAAFAWDSSARAATRSRSKETAVGKMVEKRQDEASTETDGHGLEDAHADSRAQNGEEGRGAEYRLDNEDFPPLTPQVWQ